MLSKGPRQPGAEMPGPARFRKARRFQTGMRGLIVAVACCGLIAWAGRSLWESQHPAIGAARGLRSSNPAEREGAARQLLALGIADPDRAIPPLVTALDDPEVQVRLAAAESLGAIAGEMAGRNPAGDRVRGGVAVLIGALKDRDPAVRIVGATALQSIAARKGMAGLIDIQAVIDALAAALGDRDAGARLTAIRAMAQVGPIARADPPAALVALLDDRSAKHRSAAVEALANFPIPLDPHLPTLLRGVEQTAPEFRRGYWGAFARMRPPAFSAAAIPGLVEALGSRSRIVRSHAARALYPLTSEPRAAVAIPALLPLLREPIDSELILPTTNRADRWDGWDTFVVAAEDLGRLAPGTKWAGEVAAALTEGARSDQVSRWASAARALGAFGPAAEPAVPALVHILREGLARADVQRYGHGVEAARALGRIAPGTKSAYEAFDALMEALDAPPESHLAEMFAALEALPAFGPSAARALPRLRDLGKGTQAQLEIAADKAATAIEGKRPADQVR